MIDALETPEEDATQSTESVTEPSGTGSESTGEPEETATDTQTPEASEAVSESR